MTGTLGKCTVTDGPPMRAGVVHASSDLLREFAPSKAAAEAAVERAVGGGEGVEGGGGESGGGESDGEGGGGGGEGGVASAPPATPSTTLTATAALVPAAAAPAADLAPAFVPAAAAPAAAPAPATAAAAPAAAASAALVPAARGTLIDLAGAALKKARKGQKEEAIDRVLCSTFQDVEAGGALALVQSLFDPLDDSSLSSARNAFYCEETGIQLKRHGKPPTDALWPGDCEQPPGDRVILLPGFKNKGAETTLRKQWWLRVAVALAVCIRKGQRMAMRCCKIKSGANKDDLALFMCAPRPPQPQSFTCVLTGLEPCLQQRGRRKGAGARHAGGRLRLADGARGRARPDVL